MSWSRIVTPVGTLAIVSAALGTLAVAPPGASAAPHGHGTYGLHVVHLTTPQGKRQAETVDGIAGDGTVLGTFSVGGRNSQAARAFLLPPHGKPTVLRYHHESSLGDAISNDGTAVFETYKPRGAETSRILIREPSGAIHPLAIRGLGDSSAAASVDGINDKHVIVGAAFPGHGRFLRGFVQRPGRKAGWFHLPLKRAIRIYPSGINDRGVIVGSFEDRAHFSHGFIDDHGKVRVIDLPGSSKKSYLGSNVAAIADDGSWVGAATFNQGNGAETSYVARGGRDLVALPKTTDGVEINANSINDAGKIGGLIRPDPGGPPRLPKGFVGKFFR